MNLYAHPDAHVHGDVSGALKSHVDIVALISYCVVVGLLLGVLFQWDLMHYCLIGFHWDVARTSDSVAVACRTVLR